MQFEQTTKVIRIYADYNRTSPPADRAARNRHVTPCYLAYAEGLGIVSTLIKFYRVRATFPSSLSQFSAILLPCPGSKLTLP